LVGEGVSGKERMADDDDWETAWDSGVSSPCVKAIDAKANGTIGS